MILNKMKKIMADNFSRFYNSKIGLFLRRVIGVPIDLYKQKRSANYWSKIIKEYQNGRIPPPSIIANKELKDDLIIWQYWGQGITNDLPPLVKLSFSSVDKFKGNFKVIRLDDYSIGDYLNIPDSILNKVRQGQFSRTFFSDLLRLSLLYHYGGIWLDSTIILTSEINREYLDNDFFIFQRAIDANNKKRWFNYNRFYFSWSKLHKVNSLSGFFYSKKNATSLNKILTLFNYYCENENSIKHYFLIQILLNELKNSKELCCEPAVVDDTYPHLLLLELENEFNQEKYNEIILKSNIHVFRHNIPVKKDSFYEYIINSINPELLIEFKK